MTLDGQLRNALNGFVGVVSPPMAVPHRERVKLLSQQPHKRSKGNQESPIHSDPENHMHEGSIHRLASSIGTGDYPLERVTPGQADLLAHPVPAVHSAESSSSLTDIEIVEPAEARRVGRRFFIGGMFAAAGALALAKLQIEAALSPVLAQEADDPMRLYYDKRMIANLKANSVYFSR